MVCELTETDQSFFLNRIRLILKPKKTERNLINLILWLFEKIQFAKTFLSYQTIITNI